ncbi:head-tail adaptor protein [Propylenella binzhouense]|uniref:Head-tail adaptor protein n=1 Tax=Propylenella binzhouense TaxID=2555902 RepID=A0A964WS03_9HYPH|nr:head-tail adaptor protein [Propylenella binzhouense]MYZ46458.1 head-tail adaptor protein [Propylenella binzhouense]
MIRAGKLDRLVIIERATVAIDGYGREASTWTTIATLRAEIVDGATADDGESRTTFRTRFASIVPTDRLIYAGEARNIVEVRELGRRRGLEITTTTKGPTP